MSSESEIAESASPDQAQEATDAAQVAASGEDVRSSQTLVRRSPLTEEQREQIQRDVQALSLQLQRAIRENGAGQALAWLDAQASRQDVELLQVKLCSLLELPSSDHKLFPSYASLSSLEAVQFRTRVEEALHTIATA